MLKKRDELDFSIICTVEPLSDFFLLFALKLKINNNFSLVKLLVALPTTQVCALRLGRYLSLALNQ
jgi:hypothetical protein